MVNSVKQISQFSREEKNQPNGLLGTQRSSDLINGRLPWRPPRIPWLWIEGLWIEQDLSTEEFRVWRRQTQQGILGKAFMDSGTPNPHRLKSRIIPLSKEFVSSQWNDAGQRKGPGKDTGNGNCIYYCQYWVQTLASPTTSLVALGHIHMVMQQTCTKSFHSNN